MMDLGDQSVSSSHSAASVSGELIPESHVENEAQEGIESACSQNLQNHGASLDNSFRHDSMLHFPTSEAQESLGNVRLVSRRQIEADIRKLIAARVAKAHAAYIEAHRRLKQFEHEQAEKAKELNVLDGDHAEHDTAASEAQSPTSCQPIILNVPCSHDKSPDIDITPLSVFTFSQHIDQGADSGNPDELSSQPSVDPNLQLAPTLRQLSSITPSRNSSARSSEEKMLKDKPASHNTGILTRLISGRDEPRHSSTCAPDPSRDLQKGLRVSFMAWILTFVLLIVALTFLTNTFIQQRRNPVLQRRYHVTKTLPLPVITVCNRFEDMPSFSKTDVPESKKFRGLPIFAVSRVMNSAFKKDLRYPDTSEMVTERFYGPSHNYCVKRMQGMTLDYRPRTIQSSFAAGTGRCRSCFSVGVDSTTTLKQMSSSERRKVFQGVSIQVAVSGLLRYCMFSELRTQVPENLIIAQIFDHRHELLKRGIISDTTGQANFSNPKVFTRRRLGRVIPPYSLGVEFYCNVYFLSGYFYPAKANNDIGYVYDPSILFWRKNPTKKGPFFEDPRRKKKQVRNESTAVLMSLANGFSWDVYMGYYKNTSELRNRAVEQSSLVGTVDVWKMSHFRLALEKLSDNRKKLAVVSHNEEYGLRGLPQFPDIFMQSWVGVDFSHYYTQTLKDVHLFPSTLFVADIFNYISLITGLSLKDSIIFLATVWMYLRAPRESRERLRRIPRA